LDEEKAVELHRPALWKMAFKKLVPSKLIYSLRIKRYLAEKYYEPLIQQVGGLDLSRYDAIHFHETIDLGVAIGS
jgi:hypothetical protein